MHSASVPSTEDNLLPDILIAFLIHSLSMLYEIRKMCIVEFVYHVLKSIFVEVKITFVEDPRHSIDLLVHFQLIAQFGTDHFYSCDQFNEIGPAYSDISYLEKVSNATYSAMTSIDPEAIW